MNTEQREVVNISKQVTHFLEEIVGGASHEINNLVFILGLSAEVLRSTKDADEKEKQILQIEENAERIAQIIKDLRSVMKDNDTEKLTPCSISDVSDQVIELCKTRFNNHRIIFKNNVPEDVVINCRFTEITQAFLAILNSAHDAVIQNKTNRWISFDIDKDEDGKVEILISDSGPRINEKEAKEVFSSNYNKNGRKGLQLIIAKGIVESHGGTITFDKSSEANTFKIKFPEASLNSPKSSVSPRLKVV